ncbi:hypothetical protein, partial [Streptomyces sp. NPDC088141]|uniref:hypothetical protein n=1 Tax=Streptomyces sp. NPDC088141 TaxID=3155179 RepID=UPI00342601A2
ACPELFATGPWQEGSGSQTAPDPGLGSARYQLLDQFLRNFLQHDLAALLGEPVWAGVMNRLVVEMAKLPGSLRSDPRALQDLSRRLVAEAVAGNAQPGLREGVDRRDGRTVLRWLRYELAGRPLGPVVRAWAQAHADRHGVPDDSGPNTHIAPHVRAALDETPTDYSEQDAEAGPLPAQASMQPAPLSESEPSGPPQVLGTPVYDSGSSVDAEEIWENADRLGMDHAVARVFARHSLPDGVDVTNVMELAHDWGLDADEAAMLMAHVRTLGRFPEAVVGLTRAFGVGPNQVFELAGQLDVPPEHLVAVSGELPGLYRFRPEEQAASGADALRRYLEAAGFGPQDLRWFAGSGLQLRPQDLVDFHRFVLKREFVLDNLRSGAQDADVLVWEWRTARRRADAAADVAFGKHRARAEALLSDALRRTTLEAAARRLWNVSDDLLIQHDSDLGPLFLEDSDRALFFPRVSDLALLFPQDIAALHQYVERRGALDEEGWERWVKFMRSQFDALGLRTAEDWAAFGRLIQACPELFAFRPRQEASGSQTVSDPGLGSARYLPLNRFLGGFRLDLAALRDWPVWAGVMNRLVVEVAKLPDSLRSDPNALRDLADHLTAKVHANVPSERREWVIRQNARTQWRWLGCEFAVRPWGPVVREWALAYAERQGAPDDSEPYDIAPRVRAALDARLPDYVAPPEYSDQDAVAGLLPAQASVQPAPLSESGSESELSGPPPAYGARGHVPAPAAVRDWAVRMWGVEGAQVGRFSADGIGALEALRQRLGVRQMKDLLSVVAGMGEVPSVAALEGAARVLGLRDVMDLYRVLRRFPVRLDELHRLAWQRELADVFRPLNHAWALGRNRVVEQVANHLRDLVQNTEVAMDLLLLDVEHWSRRSDLLGNESGAVEAFRAAFDLPDDEVTGALLRDVARMAGAETPADRAWFFRFASDPAVAGPADLREQLPTGTWLAPAQLLVVLQYANFRGRHSVSDLRQMSFVDAHGAVEDLAGEFRHMTGRTVHEDLPVGPGAADTVEGFHDFFERVSSERFRTLFAVPEGRPVEDVFADAAAVVGALTPGGRDWLYRMAVAFGERGFAGPGPHAPWLAPARLIQLLHWADTRAGGPIGSGRTLSHLRGLEPDAAVRHLTDLAGRFEQDEQFAQQGRTVWSEPGQRPDPSRVLDDLQRWVLEDLMALGDEAYYVLPLYDVTPLEMMGYLRAVSMEPVDLHVPGLGSDGVPLHRVGTGDLVDLANLVMVLRRLPEDEMRAAAEAAGLGPSMGPFLRRLANTL